jgi:sugar phosphate isomerase/epimerase
MILGCGEWGFRNRPMAEYFEIATKLGFRHLEFGIGGGWPGRLPDEPTAADVDSFRRLVARHGVSARHCCLENDFTRPDAAQHEADVRKVAAQIPAAAACGASVVRLFAGFTPVEQMTDAIWNRLIAALNTSAEAAARHGMTIALETHGAISMNPDGSATHRHTVSTHRDWLPRLIQELPKGVAFNYDPGNLKAVNPDDTGYALDLLQGHITYCHLKDWKRLGQGWVACAPGDDSLDYAALLPSRGYDGVYLVEYEPLEDTIDGFQRSLSYLQRVIPAAKL